MKTNYTLSDEEIKEGDYAVSPESKKNKPLLVSKNEFGYLGMKSEGWFEWIPIGKRHKKVIFINPPHSVFFNQGV